MATFNQNATWLGYIDLSKNELRNARVHNLGTAPSSPVEGQIYYDTALHQLLWWNNTSWVAAMSSAVSYGTATTQAIGDTAVDGVATTVSRSDHKHGLPAFGAVTGQTSYGSSSGNGSASTISRSDHVHGTPSLTTNVASTQALGDAASAGTGTLAAKDDHKHAMPSLGNVTAQTSFGAASGNGSAATPSRSDHVHGTPAHDASAHSSIKISDLAVPTASVSFNSQKITSLADGTLATDAATWGQVQNLIAGLDWKASVRAVITTNNTLATAYANGQAIGGVTLATGDRILLAGQTTASENGIWIVTAGAPTRATDADANGEISIGTVVPVEAGTGANTFYYCTATGATPWVAGTSTSTWSFLFTITATQAGNGLTATGNVLAVGAGTGISVAADSVAVDTTVVARKYIAGTGPGSTGTTWAITHSLGNRDVAFHVYDASTYAEVYCDAVRTDANTLTLTFASTVTLNTLRAVVIG